MKILYILHTNELNGGASISAVTLIDEMIARGHKVGVVVPLAKGRLLRYLRARGIKTYWSLYRWWIAPRQWSILYYFIYLVEWIGAAIIAFIVRIGHYQIIHSNSSVIDVGSKAARLTGCKHIWHFREFGDLDFKLVFLAGKEKSMKKIAQTQDEIVFISNSIKDHYLELTKTNPTHVIYNGISKKFLNYHEHNNSKIIFLNSAMLTENKGQYIILRAVKHLKELGYKNFEVWMAGSTYYSREAEKFKCELEKYIAENELTEVKMLGHISNMLELRHKADVEIVASYMEAFGRVTIESMMSGNPVIASDSGANPEIVIDGYNGWLFENKNPESLADKMRNVLDNAGILTQFGENAYLYAKSNFLSDVNTGNIEALYGELCK